MALARVWLQDLQRLGEGLQASAPLQGSEMQRQPLLVTWTTGERSFVQQACGNGFFSAAIQSCVWHGLPQALNFALSIRRNVAHLEKSFIIVALDTRAHEELSSYGFKTLLYSNRESDLSDLVWKFRWKLLLLAARLGLPMGVVDADVVAFRDPFPLLGHDADLEIATEHFWPEKHLWKGWGGRLALKFNGQTSLLSWKAGCGLKTI